MIYAPFAVVLSALNRKISQTSKDAIEKMLTQFDSELAEEGYEYGSKELIDATQSAQTLIEEDKTKEEEEELPFDEGDDDGDDGDDDYDEDDDYDDLEDEYDEDEGGDEDYDGGDIDDVPAEEIED